MALAAWQLLSVTCFQIPLCYILTVEVDASKFSQAHFRSCAIGHVIVQRYIAM